MKYIINERQYRLLTEEEQEVLQISSLNVFGGWESLQKLLERKGNPLYSFEGYLNLRGTNIESLGSLTSVGGSLFLNGCENLTSLGSLTSVGSSLDLRGTNIESLGNLTSVGGSLDLRTTNIESIGALTSVGGNLNLTGCKKLTSLGNLTSVGGILDLKRTPISRKYSRAEIRQMVKVDGDIYL